MPRPYPREEARILALVIPVQTGIQQNLGSRFRGNDRMASSDQVLTVLIIFSGSYFVEEFRGSKMATFSTPSFLVLVESRVLSWYNSHCSHLSLVRRVLYDRAHLL